MTMVLRYSILWLYVRQDPHTISQTEETAATQAHIYDALCDISERLITNWASLKTKLFVFYREHSNS